MSPAEEKKTVQESTAEEPRPVVVRREPEKDLFIWSAPARPFKRRDREFYVTIMAMGGIIALILFLVGGFMPVVLIVSLFFLFYVLSTVEPEKVEYKITTKGVKIAEKLTPWQSLIRFWFGNRSGSEILIFETYSIPGRIEMMINPEIKAGLKKEISAYIPYEEVPASGLDRVTDWVAQKLPGNK